jgi:predicted DsbA family dithiol-disulfide isomerase
MKIEIWSDVACPFCYIGKKHLELALEKLGYQKKVEITWKSYLLDPSLPDIPVANLYESLALKKGLSLEQVKQMTAHVEQMAKQVDLFPNFNTTLPVTTLNAHKLLQLAKVYSLGNQTKDRLFKAYFVDGLNIANKEVLKRLGQEIGIEASFLIDLWNDAGISERLNADLYEAQTLGISGVPFFLIENKYAISGAQPVEVFTNALKSIYESREENSKA